jgi:hypothetical protein
MAGRGHRLRAGRDRGGRSQQPGRGRAQLPRRRRDPAAPAHLGTFGFFPGIGCFQSLDAGQRLSQGQGVTELASPGATLLLRSFGLSRWRPLVGGASHEEVETAFAGWQMLAAEPADTAGLGWPMNKTAPAGTGCADEPGTTLSCLALSGWRPTMPRSAHSCR